jgi:hypothetical protein
MNTAFGYCPPYGKTLRSNGEPSKFENVSARFGATRPTCARVSFGQQRCRFGRVAPVLTFDFASANSAAIPQRSFRSREFDVLSMAYRYCPPLMDSALDLRQISAYSPLKSIISLQLRRATQRTALHAPRRSVGKYNRPRVAVHTGRLRQNDESAGSRRRVFL